jgi:hypothetical protein
MTTDTSKITTAANDLGDGLAKGGAAAKTLGQEIVNAIKSLDSRVTALESSPAPIPPDPGPGPDPAPDHPYEDLTKYYKFPSGTVTFPDANSVHCLVAAGDHAVWDSNCDFAGLSRESVGKFPTGSNIHLDYHFKIDAGDPMTGNWVICGEIHNDDGTLGRATSPPMSIHFDKDHMSIVAIAGGTSSSNDKWMWPYTDANKIERGKDYHLRVDVKFTKDGYLKVTRDGAVLLDYKGNIGYGAPTYWMPDIYRSNTNPTTRETTAVGFSKMQVWTD